MEEGRYVDDLTMIWPLPMLQRYHRCVHNSYKLFSSEMTYAFDHDRCRYIQFVKGNFRPVLSKEAEEIISSYYRLQRRSSTHNAGSFILQRLLSCINQR